MASCRPPDVCGRCGDTRFHPGVASETFKASAPSEMVRACPRPAVAVCGRSPLRLPLSEAFLPKTIPTPPTLPSLSISTFCECLPLRLAGQLRSGPPSLRRPAPGSKSDTTARLDFQLRSLARLVGDDDVRLPLSSCCKNSEKSRSTSLSPSRGTKLSSPSSAVSSPQAALTSETVSFVLAVLGRHGRACWPNGVRAERD
jgi:hypothetical protein